MKKIFLMLLLISGMAAMANAQDTTRVKKTPEERAAQNLKMMQKKLNLTTDQSKKISVILQDRAEKMDMPKTKGVKGTGMMKMQAMADADKKIEAVLTDDQKKTYAAMKEKVKERRMNKLDAKAPNGTTPPTQ